MAVGKEISMIKFELTETEVINILNESQYFRSIVVKELNNKQPIVEVPPTKSAYNPIEIPADELRMIKFVVDNYTWETKIKATLALREWIVNNENMLTFDTYQKVDTLYKCKQYVENLLNVPF